VKVQTCQQHQREPPRPPTCPTTLLNCMLANLQAKQRIRLLLQQHVAGYEARYNPYLNKHSTIDRRTSYIQVNASYLYVYGKLVHTVRSQEVSNSSCEHGTHSEEQELEAQQRPQHAMLAWCHRICLHTGTNIHLQGRIGAICSTHEPAPCNTQQHKERIAGGFPRAAAYLGDT
jgi:hypothetical protein